MDSLNFAWAWLCEGKINLLFVCISLGSFPRKIPIRTCTPKVLPVVSGSLGGPVLSLGDWLKVYVPWVRFSLVQGRDNNSVPQWESCFIVERPLMLGNLFWQVLLELAHCTCLIKLVCLLDGQLRGNGPCFSILASPSRQVPGN